MGLQRPAEPFDRVYSAPEPPSPARKPRLLVLLAAVVAVAAAGAAVFLLLPGGDAGDAASGPAKNASEAVSPSAMQERVVKALPAPCQTVSDGTVESAVPEATKRESANSTLTTCTYTSTGSEFRWLRVEAHLYAPGNTATPVRDAEGYYDAQWAQAHEAPLARTISLERHAGLGDEAYRWFKADEGQPTVVGQVTARVRNAVVTVSYSEKAPGGAARDERERACLDRATAAAREVLAALNHF